MGPDFNWSSQLTSAMLPDPRSLCPVGTSSPVYQNISIRNNDVTVKNALNGPASCSEVWRCSNSFISANSMKSSSYDVPRISDTVSQYCFASKLSEEEQVILKETYNYLDNCLYFYQDFQMEAARLRLNNYQVGTFLLRPSSDPNYLLSLSVKTSRGTTSVRIAFKNKKFYLDSDPNMRHQLPTFDSIPSLLHSYMKLATSVHKNRVVFLEASGRKDTPISLKKPCLRVVGSLKHLCRLVIHSVHASDTLHQLPEASTSIIDFLQTYPHSV